MSMNLQNPPDVLMGVVPVGHVSQRGHAALRAGEPGPGEHGHAVDHDADRQPRPAHLDLGGVLRNNANHTICTLTAGYTVTLPAAASMAIGQELVIKNIAVRSR